MGKIQFGSKVYTWFMQGTGKGCDNNKHCYDIAHSGLDPKVTGWTPDVGHIIRGGIDVIAALNKWQHLVNHIHYKDFSGNGAEPWAQMGTGRLDFHKITEWLVARDDEGWIICADKGAAPNESLQHRTIDHLPPLTLRSP